MSKAILIIDVDENADFENAIADITFRDNQWGVAPIGIKHWYNGIKVKPLPRKEKGRNWHSAIAKENTYVCGWNDCIDEILGVNENE